MTVAVTTTFPAWSTTVYLAADDLVTLRAAETLTRRIMAEVERACSRFRSDSDLTAVNRRSGAWVAVDPVLVHAVQVALRAAVETGGLVSPLLGRQLAQLGYDRDIRLLDESAEVAVPALTTPDPEAWRDIRVDPDGALQIPEGTALDLGSSAKAWTADLVAAAGEDRLDRPVLVCVGGDLRVGAPDGRAWQVAIGDRPDGVVDVLVGLDGGGLATSSTRVRRWTSRGVRRHHVLDPRTGLPAAERWRTVSATGATCVGANTAATAAIVLGDAAPAWLAARGVAARLVAADGAVHLTGDWPKDAA